MRRRGSFLLDLGAALGALGIIGAILVGASVERHAAAADERRSAALETAQNLLEAARHGVALLPPAGWSIERHAVAGAVEVRVRGGGVELATLIAAERP